MQLFEIVGVMTVYKAGMVVGIESYLFQQLFEEE